MRATLITLVLGTVIALATACGQQVAGEPKAAENLVANRPSAKPATTTRPSRPSSTPRTTSTRPTAKPDKLGVLVGTWEGQYTCGQGNTGLKLIIKEPRDRSLPVVFEFFPVPDNPSAKSGSYAMVGSFAASGQLVFKQQEWINQPPGYMMVDLAVTSPLEEGTDQLSGDVLDSSCKGFSVRRR